MNTQMLLENFALIASAPGGVKRLREMILQLAVTGTLTEREQNDTQADVLFRRNQEHRDRLIEKKELHIQKPLPPIDNASVPWILPDTWKWCRLGQVTSYGSTDKAEYLDVNSETWVLELEDIEKETSRLLSKIRAKDRKFLSSKNKFVRGQVLYGKLRPYLDKVVIADEGGVCTTEIIPILPFAGILSEYLRWYLKCPFFKSYANNSTHGMNLPRLGTEPARLALFAFPPVEEQQRIVAKVDELMALCDKLETQQQEREQRFPVLSRACHARFVESPTLANLKAIFDEAGSISTNELRKTVLDLAVQGKLVRQETGEIVDEELLSKMKISKNPIKTSEHLFFIPKSWIWTRLGDIYKSSFYGPRFGKNEYVIQGGIPTVRTTDMTMKGEIILRNPPHVEIKDKNKLASYALNANDLLITRSGTIGMMAVFKESYTAIPSAYLIRFRFPESVLADFYYIYLSSRYGLDLLGLSLRSIGVPNVNATSISRFPAPLPPLAEQRRIVAKVNQLMALIDKLEEQQARKAKIAEAFAQAAVNTITGAEIKLNVSFK